MNQAASLCDEMVMKLNSVAYRKNTFSELREPAAIGQKALRKS